VRGKLRKSFSFFSGSTQRASERELIQRIIWDMKNYVTPLPFSIFPQIYANSHLKALFSLTHRANGMHAAQSFRFLFNQTKGKASECGNF
jgi:hypothetical protein